MGTAPDPGLPLSRVRAVVLDTDGVVTDTASVHAGAWKRVFDTFLLERSRAEGTAFVPFDAHEDYLRHVDGRTRTEGVRTFLASRGIGLPEQGPPGGPDTATVAGLARSKDRHFLDLVDRDGVRAFPGTVDFVRALRSAGLPVAAASASRNCARVLRAAGVEDLFDARVDGNDAARLHLPGKPDPALFLEAVRRLGAEPGRTALAEDALVGVRAGRNGGFGLVIGVDRSGVRERMLAEGAHVVVGDLAELLPVAPAGGG